MELFSDQLMIWVWSWAVTSALEIKMWVSSASDYVSGSAG